MLKGSYHYSSLQLEKTKSHLNYPVMEIVVLMIPAELFMALHVMIFTQRVIPTCIYHLTDLEEILPDIFGIFVKPTFSLI